jgi:hypothetical protein
MNWTCNATVFLRNLLGYGQPSQAGFNFGGGLLGEGPELQLRRTVVEEHLAAPRAEERLLCYFETTTCTTSVDSATSLMSSGNLLCLVRSDLIVACGPELRCFEGGSFACPPLIMGSLREQILGLCLNHDVSLMAARSEFEIQVFRLAVSGQVTPCALVGPALLGHEHACRVTDCAFGLRSDEVLWTLNCGHVLCTNLLSQQTLRIHKLEGNVLCCRNIGHSRRFVMLAPQGDISMVSFSCGKPLIPGICIGLFLLDYSAVPGIISEDTSVVHAQRLLLPSSERFLCLAV